MAVFPAKISSALALIATSICKAILPQCPPSSEMTCAERYMYAILAFLVHHHPTFWEKEKERVPNYLSPGQDSPRPVRGQGPLLPVPRTGCPHCLISLLT